MKLEVLYEDNHCIAAVKPSGMLSQGDKTRDRSFMDDVKHYLKEKYKKPGNVFLGLVHRIDRPVSGIVLFAKTSKGASRLSEQFRNHTILKTYHALAIGMFKQKRGALFSRIAKDERRKKAKAGERGKSAELEYGVVEEGNGHTLLALHAKTGRFHQIRFQLAEVGHPIVGDVKYGAGGGFTR